MAKRFKFRLDQVLNIRSHKVKQAKDALMDIISLRIQKEAEIEAKMQYLESLMKPAKGGHTLASDLQTLLNHKAFIKQEIKNLNIEKQRIIEIEELKRLRLNEAMKEERVLSKLKDRKMLEHNEAQNKEETYILNEIAINRHMKASE